jgi:hypothetical protein
MNKRTIGISICIIVTIIEVFVGNSLFSFIADILLLVLLIWIIQKIRKGITGLGGYLLIVVICLLATVGPYSFLPTFGTYAYQNTFGLVFGALITILAYKDKKLKEYTTGALLLTVFIASTIWFGGQIMLMNVALDHSEAVQHGGKITTKVISQKLWSTYYINIDFKDKSTQEQFTSGLQVRKKRYYEYKEGDMIRVVVNDGFLGIKYYSIIWR